MSAALYVLAGLGVVVAVVIMAIVWITRKPDGMDSYFDFIEDEPVPAPKFMVFTFDEADGTWDFFNEVDTYDQAQENVDYLRSQNPGIRTLIDVF